MKRIFSWSFPQILGTSGTTWEVYHPKCETHGRGKEEVHKPETTNRLDLHMPAYVKILMYAVCVYDVYWTEAYTNLNSMCTCFQIYTQKHPNYLGISPCFPLRYPSSTDSNELQELRLSGMSSVQTSVFHHGETSPQVLDDVGIWLYLRLLGPYPSLCVLQPWKISINSSFILLG